MKSSSGSPLLRVRRSRVHGTGVFAARAIRKGTRIAEYTGDRISHAEADRRYAHKSDDDNHTFLFTVDGRTVIDGGSGGSAARFINHSCDPNCETIIEDRRVFIESIRSIAAGAEIGYDYMIDRDPSDPPNVDEIFACRCGAQSCRGTMLLPPKKPRRKAAKKKIAKKKSTQKKAAKKAVRKAVKKAARKAVRKSSTQATRR
jgi:SET domain-containing protein